MRWEEVDFERGVINIPWQRVKGRSIKRKVLHPLQLPIMPVMQQVLEEQKGLSETFVFPQLTKDASMTINVASNRLRRSGLNFSTHDIRRTVATTLEDMDGVSLEDVDIVLDHAIQGVNKSYVKRKNLLERKRKILSKWHTYLSGLVNTSITTIKAVSGGI